VSQQAIEIFKEKSPQQFSEYYGMQAKPICGDYLTSIAVSKLNVGAEEFHP
jgi:hypothetical protein